MEQGCKKKREAEQIVLAGKRTKSNQFQQVEAFLKLASEISDNRKQCTSRMGFQSFLQITSMSNIDSIYLWLANHFNTTSCSIETANGFKFPITPTTVHNFFGIPIGGIPVIKNPSKVTYEFIQQELGTTSPTIEYLFSIINDDLPEDKFCRIFILILLSLFVAPNSSGVASKFVYSAIVDIDRISQYDWCLLCLSYMVYSIKKARLKNTMSKEIIPGGSKLLMVISYFEFLIITESKLPTIEPRLPLWSANMLNSYMALDALHGKSNEYGRLPIKHMSSTPFSDSNFIELPEEISQYIDSKFSDISLTQDMIILQLKAQDFYSNIIQNSTPTMKTYVDDIHSLFLKTMTSSSSPNIQFKPALSENTFKVPRTKQLLAIQSPPNFPMLDVPTIIDEDKQVTIDEILDELVNDFSQSVNITSSNFSLSLFMVIYHLSNNLLARIYLSRHQVQKQHPALMFQHCYIDADELECKDYCSKCSLLLFLATRSC